MEQRAHVAFITTKQINFNINVNTNNHVNINTWRIQQIKCKHCGVNLKLNARIENHVNINTWRPTGSDIELLRAANGNMDFLTDTVRRDKQDLNYADRENFSHWKFIPKASHTRLHNKPK